MFKLLLSLGAGAGTHLGKEERSSD